jgi:exopolysaccharide production protein ExoY
MRAGLSVNDAILNEAPASDSQSLDPVPWTFSRSVPIHKIAAKRYFDVFASVTLIILTVPITILICILLVFEGSDILFFQERVGTGGKIFRCIKFRTMTPGAEAVLDRFLSCNAAWREEWNRTCKLKNDPRVTAFGQFLRRSCLDELPQLFNVLKGDMSLVGPRPIRIVEVVRYGRRFHDYCRCRPGLTGLWQIYRNDTVDYARRTELDSFYVAHWSFRRDVLILLKTVPAMVLARGAS